MNDAPGAGGGPPTKLEELAERAADFLGDERDIRVAVLDAVDAGHSLEDVSAATHLPLAVLESWTGAVRTDPGPWASEDTGNATDELGEQRQLRNGSLTQRVEAAEAKIVRAEQRNNARA